MRHMDVVVFGAGPAGIAASISAAREGRKVVLVECRDKIGGVMSSCPGMMLGGGYPCGKTIGGFFEEFVQRMYLQEPPVAERRRCGLEHFGDEVVYEHEPAIAILCGMLAEAGVTVHTNRIPDRVLMGGGTITGVEVVDPQGRERFVARIYIDCTGNGDVAAKAGVPWQIGNADRLMMGVSLTFTMEGVDWDRAFADETDPYFTAYAAKGISEGRIHASIPRIYMLKGFRRGTAFFNTVTVTGIDGTDSDSVLKGTNEARGRVLQLARFCTDVLPGFENSRIASIGPSVGIRETRRLEGMYQLTYTDIAKATKFEDGIVACDNPLDEVFRDEDIPRSSHEPALVRGQYYTIPFRSLVPRRVDNLLFAGRNLSVDDKAFASVRGMPQCMLMGQAAGVGAALAVRDGCAVQELDGRLIADRLISQGVRGIGGVSL